MSAGDVTRDDLVRRLEGARFSPVRMREGYDMGDVDTLLDRLVQAIHRGEPVAPLVDAARFDAVRMREGYDMGEVDALLAGVRADGEALAGTGVARAAEPAGPAGGGEGAEVEAAVRRARFRPVRLTPGYDMGEVDALLEELVAAARGGRPVSPLVEAARLSPPVRWREGYHPGQVDAFLESLRHRGA